MGQLKTRIAELKQALQQLVEHNVHNPDDDDHWSGVLFFCATDERTRTLVEQVETLASELFFDPQGRALRHRMRTACIDGVIIQESMPSRGDETVIRIEVLQAGRITVSAARE
ncbi:hypothetical protein JYG36_12215 [Pseudomonas sp. SORT22]|uniref:hypothetical protein n=1 Tax=Pseudomonas sp. SORT22 TaxID=2813842 RepID=UPI001BCBDE23|nr:hypothetical protein [Pseudomonas sp. SORT22]QVM98885.1 hypothetical protein JYG36_12215 [Pseudomonas sp. SORT22]